MAFGIITEALARVEFKLDLLLRSLGTPSPTPMKFSSHACPVCSITVEYMVDLTNNVVVRKCDCSTGKLPPTIPLVPVQIGETNGGTHNAGGRADQESGEGKNRRRGKGG